MLPHLARWLCGIAGSLWSLRLGLGVYAFHVTNQLERPGYTVVRQLSNGVELQMHLSFGCSLGKSSSGRQWIGRSDSQGFLTAAGW